MEKYHAMERPYPSKKDIIDRFVSYDTAAVLLLQYYGDYCHEYGKYREDNSYK